MKHGKHKNDPSDCGYMVARLSAAEIADADSHEVKNFGIAMCVEGKARMTINLEMYEIRPDYVMVFSPNDVIRSKEMSDDFSMKVIYITRLEILREAATQVLPFVMDSGASRTFFTEEQRGVASAFNAVYTFLETLLADKDTVSKYEQGVCVFRCLLLGIRDKSARYRKPQKKIEPGNSMGYYNRFMMLLNQYGKTHHNVEFYASKLIITTSYLGRICKKYDGRSAKRIITDYLILQIKSTLKNTEKTMKEISYEFNFTTFSFMSNFFHRYAGITPSEFRSKYRSGNHIPTHHNPY